jgi:hypothetical protein
VTGSLRVKSVVTLQPRLRGGWVRRLLSLTPLLARRPCDVLFALLRDKIFYQPQSAPIA